MLWFRRPRIEIAAGHPWSKLSPTQKLGSL
jgi:hypothetical protein